jgi:hypothetical protein
MFNFFKKKSPETRVVNKVIMTEAAKWKALADQWKKNNNTVFVFWFDETLQKAETIFGQETAMPVELLRARDIHSPNPAGKQLIFAEHYPLPEKEKELFQRLNLPEIQVWSALDEPLFKEFGSDKIVQMMKQLGMKEDEVIENSMISKAISGAQEKISKKVLTDQTCPSQEEWLRKNWVH